MPLRRLPLLTALVCLLTLAAFAAADLKSLNDGQAPESPEQLAELQTRLQALARKVAPATVGLRVGRGQGSGVIVTRDGYILTAAHVSGGPGRDVQVILHDGRTVKGKTLGHNGDVDAGMIKLEGKGPWPFAPIGKSKSLKPGQWCIAMGHPGGYQSSRPAPLRLGRVLRNVATGVETDCMLINGDSGGPLFDLDGKVIGINSRIGSSLMSNTHVPVDYFTDGWDRMAKGETWGGRQSQRNGPFIGVQADQSAPNARIASVLPDSPADQAGIKAGDVIVRFGKKSISSFIELALTVRQHKPGDKVTVVVQRGEKEIPLNLTIGRSGQNAEPKPNPSDNDKPKDTPEDKQPSPEPNKPEKQPRQPKAKPTPSKPEPESKPAPEENENAAPSDAAEPEAQEQPDPEADRAAAEKAAEQAEAQRRQEEARKREAERKRREQEKQQREERQRQREEARRKAQAVQAARQRLMALRVDALRQRERDRERAEIEKNHASVLTAFAAAADPARDATVRILSDGKQIALGAVVHADGYILTKASELRQNIEVKLASGPRMKAQVVGIVDACDLALLQVPATELHAVAWSEAKPQVGTLLVTPGLAPTPLAVGVISVEPRKLHARGFLGIAFKPDGDEPRIGQIIPGTAAAEAKLKVGDLIKAIDGQETTSGAAAIEFLSHHKPGDTVTLTIERDGKESELEVTLGQRPTGPGAARMRMINMLGGELSDRRSDFPEVIQHDTILYPEQCGGPLVGLDGKVIALNIARAGRVSSYALPAATVKPLIAEMIAGKHNPSADFEMELAARTISDQIEATTLHMYKALYTRDKAQAAADEAQKKIDELEKQREKLGQD